jgi:transposase InsO family protein
VAHLTGLVLEDRTWLAEEDGREHFVAQMLHEAKENPTRRRNRPLSKSLIHIKMTIRDRLGQPGVPLDCLIDSGSTLNVISPTTAREHNLEIKPLPGALARYLDGTPLRLEGTVVADVDVVDSIGVRRRDSIQFVISETVEAPIVLGMPFLEAWNPKTDHREKTMCFTGKREPYRKIDDVTNEQMNNLLLDESNQPFLCAIRDIEAPEGPSALPERYRDFADVVSKEGASSLPEHGHGDLPIDLVPGKEPPFGPLYSLSEAELVVLREYLRKYLERGWIRHSRSPAGAPILFVKKKDGSLRLCVDYRGLNNVTVKNRHPLPLINESLDRLALARWFTLLDLREAYHRLRIKEGDEWKTAFRTRYGHFEYLVVPFGLTNAPAAFQAYINKALVGLLDVVCIVYLDDILIFSKDEEEHEKHVRLVLERLRQAQLFVNLDKSRFHERQCEYLGYLVTPEGIKLDEKRVKTIQDWPEPKTVREIRMFIGFLNYYRRFVKGFSRIAAPLHAFTRKEPGQARKGQALRNEESRFLDIGPEGRRAVQELKDLFVSVPILVHYEPGRPTRVETDASGRAVSGILSQLCRREDGSALWRPVAFYSRKLDEAQTRYDTHDAELLAIKESLEEWRHHLQGLKDPFTVLTDHSNLRYFFSTKTLSGRQARWAEFLAGFHFQIQHRKGTENPADGPSRRPDYLEGAPDEAERVSSADLASLQRQLANVGGAAPLKGLAAAVLRSVGQPGALSDASDTRQPRLVEEIAQRRLLLEQAHRDPMSGHFGVHRTYLKISRYYTWPGLRADVRRFVKACLSCRKAKSTRHAPYGLLHPLPIPETPFEVVTMDFITDLPESRVGATVYNACMVVVDKLTKMVHYVPSWKDINAQELAQLFRREVIRLHGPPREVVSDRGPQMASAYWKTFLSSLGIARKLSSGYHPQTDGQTERQNATLEEYLRIFCAFEQDDWAIWIDLAEFAYNDSEHAETGVSPFVALQGRNPRNAISPEREPDDEAPHAVDVAAIIINQQAALRKRLEFVRTKTIERANLGREEITFAKGDHALLNAKHIASARPNKKLDWKFRGPYKVLEVLSPVTVRLKLPEESNAHDVWHVSLLEKYEPSEEFPADPIPFNEKVDLDAPDVWNVEEIRERRKRGAKGWEYFVKWRNFPESANSWEPAKNFSSSLLRRFNNKLKKEAKEATKPPRMRHLPPPLEKMTLVTRARSKALRGRNAS